MKGQIDCSFSTQQIDAEKRAIISAVEDLFDEWFSDIDYDYDSEEQILNVSCRVSRGPLIYFYFSRSEDDNEVVLVVTETGDEWPATRENVYACAMVELTELLERETDRSNGLEQGIKTILRSVSIVQHDLDIDEQ